MSATPSALSPSAQGIDAGLDLSGVARRLLPSTLAQIPTPVLVFSDARTVFANHRALALFGVTAENDLLGMAVSELLHTTSGSLDIAAFGDAAASLSEFDPINVICRIRGGKSVETQAVFGAGQWQGAAACVVCFWLGEVLPMGLAHNPEPDRDGELPFDVSGTARWEWSVKTGVFDVSSEF